MIASKQKDIDSRYHEPNSYWKYILPDELIKLQRGREGLGLNHHDEHLFIVVHQAFELWFKQVSDLLSLLIKTKMVFRSCSNWIGSATQ
jgi:tryptophan 2,3-dioxygenase